tara:strand:- start:93 stop:410 length:318 start_codon:yes stop_codon:yes gene_type:complete
MYLYLILFIAIAFEVIGTMLLPLANNFTKIVPSIILLISYSISFYLLSFLSNKLSLVIIYASWSGMGIFFVSVLSYFIYKQTMNWQIGLGLIFIVIGVFLVNAFK